MSNLVIPVMAAAMMAFMVARPLETSQGAPKAAGFIDLSLLPDYEAQNVPAFITRDNMPADNAITDEGATLGRVLFHDKQLSRNGTISCSSCHRQQFAFGDTAQASIGVAGTTGRHSMRLVNARFGDERHFFWDERADSLEMQTTMPVRDHVEMGFSGTLGDPGMDTLLARLGAQPYYAPLFTAAFGDAGITEDRIQRALAQFVRSIQSFDSKYDVGRALTGNDQQPFPNFTGQENAGKQLFLGAPVFDAQVVRIAGGAGCQACHRAPEFDIDPASLNNGIINSLGGGQDLGNTRSPSLRDAIGPNAASNGPLFHSGGANGIMGVIAHYDSMPGPSNTPQLDPRLRPAGNLQRLHLTQQERLELAAFIRTLTGTAIYQDERWSDPFLNGQLTVVSGSVSLQEAGPATALRVYPVPTEALLHLELTLSEAGSVVEVRDVAGRCHLRTTAAPTIDVGQLPPGTYLLRIGTRTARFVKQ